MRASRKVEVGEHLPALNRLTSRVKGGLRRTQTSLTTSGGTTHDR